MNFTLEELKDTIKTFSNSQCEYLTESCIVALEENNHISGCIIEISGDNNAKVTLSWSTKVKRAGYQEQKKYVENGATAISFFLAQTLTDFNIIEESFIGTGFDYWLGYDPSHSKYDPSNFLTARLEISGIFKETFQNSVLNRIKIKKKQTNTTDFIKLPAYVSIVEFSAPNAYFAKK